MYVTNYTQSLFNSSNYWQSTTSSTTSSMMSALASKQEAQFAALSTYLAPYTSAQLPSVVNTDLLKLTSGLKQAVSAMKSLNVFDTSINLKSSNEQALTVTTKSKTSSYLSQPSSVETLQLATAQKTTTNRLNDNEMSFSGNSYDFTLKGKSFSIAITEDDNNRSMNNKIANAINGANLGVKATLKLDSGQSYLEISSTETGVENGFETDMDIVDTTTEAQDLIYKLDDGEERTSASNTVKINNNVTFEFRSVEPEVITLEKVADNKVATEAANAFVNAFNALLDYANDNKDVSSGAASLSAALATTARTYDVALKPLGIQADYSGRLSVDSEKLTTAVQNGGISRVFQSSISGFGGKLNTIMNDTASGKYTDKVNFFDYYYSNALSTTYSNSTASFFDYLI